MLLGLASLQKENTLNEAARKLLNLIILPAIIMAPISLVKYPCQKNSSCSEDILKKQQIVTMKCIKKLNPNILCKFMRLFSLVFFFL